MKRVLLAALARRLCLRHDRAAAGRAASAAVTTRRSAIDAPADRGHARRADRRRAAHRCALDAPPRCAPDATRRPMPASRRRPSCCCNPVFDLSPRRHRLDAGPDRSGVSADHRRRLRAHTAPYKAWMGGFAGIGHRPGERRPTSCTRTSWSPPAPRSSCSPATTSSARTRPARRPLRHRRSICRRPNGTPIENVLLAVEPDARPARRGRRSPTRSRAILAGQTVRLRMTSTNDFSTRRTSSSTRCRSRRRTVRSESAYFAGGAASSAATPGSGGSSLIAGSSAISMRRFFARPSAFALLATGSWSPAPAAITFFGSMPAVTSTRVTVSARSVESCQLSAGAQVGDRGGRPSSSRSPGCRCDRRRGSGGPGTS